MKKRADGRYKKVITVEEGGKKVRKYFYGKSINEINRKILAYQGEKEKGKSFSELADDWWEFHEKTLEHNSLHGYVSALKCAKEYFGDTSVKEIKTMNIDAYVFSFATKGYSYKTIAMKLQVLRQILSYAVRIGEIENNCALNVSMPRNMPKKTRMPPSEEEILKIKNNVSHPFGLFAFFLLHTGLRRGEALAIQGSDFDFKNNTISVTKSVYYKYDKPFIKQPKTAAGVRTVPLLPALKEVLPKLKPNELLFNYEGELYHNKRFETQWKHYCRDTGIDCTPHQLRHAYATRLYEIGVDEKSAQYLLGHADSATTRDIYTHLTEKKKLQTAQLLINF